MNRTRATLVALMLFAAVPSTALADATLFLGTTTTPANRVAKGFAVGISLLALGVEFEYSGTSDAPQDNAGALNTGTVSVLLQTPVEIFGIQPYLAGGVGLYREKLEALDHQETNVASSIGGGLKVGLAGPVRLRLDYRVFKLAGGALNSPAHRIYAGLNLKF
jgi:opacity protein-like surface antigen